MNAEMIRPMRHSPARMKPHAKVLTSPRTPPPMAAPEIQARQTKDLNRVLEFTAQSLAVQFSAPLVERSAPFVDGHGCAEFAAHVAPGFAIAECLDVERVGLAEAVGAAGLHGDVRL